MRIKVKTELFTDELLEFAHDFSSGNDFLDDFIKSSDALNDGIGKTFVWIDEDRTHIKDRTHIIGYYNIGMGYIDFFDGQEKIKIGGSVHLNFFALDSKYRGVIVNEDENVSGKVVRVSDKLFADFLQKVMHIRDNYIGFSFITLAATDEGYSLYKRHYFEDLDAELHFSFKDDEKGCKPMYLALNTD